MTEDINWLSRGLDLRNKIKCKSLLFESPVTINKMSAGNLKIGAWSYIQFNANIMGNTKIGRYCSIAEEFITSPPDHPTDYLSTSTSQYQRSQFEYWMPEDLPLVKKVVRPKRAPTATIGNDVWIGRGVMIMRGVTIGDGAIIGARSVVTKDVPPYAIVGGVPAKLIRMRFNPDLVERMMRVRWWQYDRTDLRDVPFDDPERALDDIEQRIDAGTLKPRPIEYQEYLTAP